MKFKQFSLPEHGLLLKINQEWPHRWLDGPWGRQFSLTK